MTDLKNQEQLRDNIAGILELSRASWKAETNDSQTKANDKAFPRSILFRTLTRHPVLSATAVAYVWYLGPGKFTAMAVAGGSLIMRHHLSILPLAQRFLSR